MGGEENRGHIFLRTVQCFCRHCVMSNFDACLIEAEWKRLEVRVNPATDSVRLERLAYICHYEHWDKPWHAN